MKGKKLPFDNFKLISADEGTSLLRRDKLLVPSSFLKCKKLPKGSFKLILCG
jgi:hypothetical protein